MKKEEENKLNISKEEHKKLEENIVNKKENNYIISEIKIERFKINKKIRLLNSFEQIIRGRKKGYSEDSEDSENSEDSEDSDDEEEDKFVIKKEEYYKFENEKEIKDNCIIEINNNKIGFSYFHEFKEEGTFIIKYTFLKNITKTDFMFCGCRNLKNINLSNFNTENVTNMSYMFYECYDLTNLNLSNLNTENVTNMSYMFSDCSSLTNLNLSNFNTENVTNMSSMFYDCYSLTNINLSNFNTENVINMIFMYSYCCSLIKKNKITEDI